MNHAPPRTLAPVQLPGREPMPAQVPRHTRDRVRLAIAHRESLGYAPGDEDQPSGVPSTEALLMVCCAAIGLCCRMEGVPSLASLRYDVLEYGEEIFDALADVGTGRQIYSEGQRLIREVIAALPTPAAVEEAADPFAGQREPGTDSSPASG